MVRRIVLEAGARTLSYFDEGVPAYEEKSDGSPVTHADREAEEIITAGLHDLLPGIPVIGEEAAARNSLPALDGGGWFWLVDPLDGTREFIAGGTDFTVNVALIHGGVPVLGVVYAPAKGELYAGSGADTAVRYLEDTDSEKSIFVRRPPASGLVVLSSRLHGDAGRLESFLAGYKVAKVVKSSSSLKLCAIAAGKADMYPRFGPTSQWDTAAGDAVLRAAGAGIYDMTGAALAYGPREGGFLNPEFVACREDLIRAGCEPS
jgi:3'(2'), 5'-bisphosphate nucleotidase